VVAVVGRGFTLELELQVAEEYWKVADGGTFLVWWVVADERDAEESEVTEI
jgi:hypothetical protein